MGLLHIILRRLVMISGFESTKGTQFVAESETEGADGDLCAIGFICVEIGGIAILGLLALL
jgi:hypothetical protein